MANAFPFRPSLDICNFNSKPSLLRRRLWKSDNAVAFHQQEQCMVDGIVFSV